MSTFLSMQYQMFTQLILNSRRISSSTMSTVKAVVIKAGDAQPTYKDIPYEPPTASEVRIKVLGTAIHHLVRARALGKHYSVSASTEERLIGVDGVGQTDDGQLVAFANFAPGKGSFAEYVNVDKRFIFPFPKEVSSNDEEAIKRVTALSNPVMSSIFALGSRVKHFIKPGFTVAINGVTGASGGFAAEIARKVFGASKVIGVGRSREKLEGLVESKGLDEIIPLTDSDEEIVSKFSKFDVDVILDYTWGEAAQKTLLSVIKSRKDPSKLLSFVQIGQIGGNDFSIPPGILRGQNVFILGSGLGSVSDQEMAEAFVQITDILARGVLGKDHSIETAKASEISTEWDLWQPNSRKVFTF